MPDENFQATLYIKTIKTQSETKKKKEKEKEKKDETETNRMLLHEKILDFASC
jgi:hypothetical protein